MLLATEQLVGLHKDSRSTVSSYALELKDPMKCFDERGRGFTSCINEGESVCIAIILNSSCPAGTEVEHCLRVCIIGKSK